MKEYGSAARSVQRAQLSRLFLQSRFFIPLFLCMIGLAACGSPATNATSTPTPKPTPTPAVPMVSTATITYKGHVGPAIGASWSPDGTRIASCGNDGTVQVWDAHSGHALWSMHIGRYAFAVAWSPDGTRIASGHDDKTVRIWDAASGHTLLEYTGHSDAVFKVAWSPDGTQIASASGDGTVQVWTPHA